MAKGNFLPKRVGEIIISATPIMTITMPIAIAIMLFTIDFWTSIFCLLLRLHYIKEAAERPASPAALNDSLYMTGSVSAVGCMPLLGAPVP
jgi:hypothetical protein